MMHSKKRNRVRLHCDDHKHTQILTVRCNNGQKWTEICFSVCLYYSANSIIHQKKKKMQTRPVHQNCIANVTDYPRAEYCETCPRWFCFEFKKWVSFVSDVRLASLHVQNTVQCSSSRVVHCGHCDHCDTSHEENHRRERVRRQASWYAWRCVQRTPTCHPANHYLRKRRSSFDL